MSQHFQAANFSRTTASQRHTKTTNGSTETTDIGLILERYKKLLDFLFPFKVAYDLFLYIVRWKSYGLTVAVGVVLCTLLYYPSLFLTTITLALILTMVIGKYYGQTKALSILKFRQPPLVHQINQDTQELERIHNEQRASQLLVVEYKELIHTVEDCILQLTNFLEYLYRLILWQSMEVSLCVSVLLCLCCVLLCTINLRFITASIPALVLCFNTHFIYRTVDLWKALGNWLFRHRVKPEKAVEQPPAVHLGVPPATETPNTDEAPSRSQEEMQEPDTNSLNTTSIVTESSDPINTTTPLLVVRDSPRPSPTVASCAKCKASLGSIFRRKYACNKCGNFFCASCSVKVKRSFLGATAPAAFNESVRICSDCKKEIDNSHSNDR